MIKSGLYSHHFKSNLLSIARHYVPLSISNTTVLALLDGGAMINCIHKKIIDPILASCPQYKILPNNLGKIGTADKDGQLPVIGRITLPCYFGKTILHLTFAVCETLSQDIILGRPFSKSHVHSLNESSNTLHLINQDTVQLESGPDGYTSPIHSITAISVPPSTCIKLHVRTSPILKIGTHGVIVPLSKYKDAVAMSLSTVLPGKQTVIQIENVSDDSNLEIPAGSLLGIFENLNTTLHSHRNFL